MTRAGVSRRDALGLLALALLVACTEGPRALVPGQDACAYCRMTIDDPRFGALVRTAKGKLQTFDSIECAAAFVAALPEAERPQAVWVADFDAPAQWVVAERAQYLHQSSARSPMGRELAAFSATADPAALVRTYGGRTIAWSDVLALAVTAPTADHRP